MISENQNLSNDDIYLEKLWNLLKSKTELNSKLIK